MRLIERLDGNKYTLLEIYHKRRKKRKKINKKLSYTLYYQMVNVWPHDKDTLPLETKPMIPAYKLIVTHIRFSSFGYGCAKSYI